MQDLLAALTNFQQGATQLATGRAIRSASDQAQQINLMEGDEFKKRQAFTQLGQGLAAQLSSYGASPSQVQQMSQNYMPTQLAGPQDFFAQATQATTPQSQAQYQQAGIQLQNTLAAAPLTTQQKAQNILGQKQVDLGYAGLIASQQGAANKGKEAKILTDDQSKAIMALDNQLVGLNGLLKDVQTDPNLVGPGNKVKDLFGLRGMTNPNFAAFKNKVLKNFDAYRTQVTGAGASEGELRMLETRQPNVDDSLTEFMAKTKAALMVGENVRKRNLTTLGNIGYDVSTLNAAPVTSYGKNLQKFNADMSYIDQAQNKLADMLTQNQQKPDENTTAKIETLRDAIKARQSKIGY